MQPESVSSECMKSKEKVNIKKRTVFFMKHARSFSTRMPFSISTSDHSEEAERFMMLDMIFKLRVLSLFP